MKETPIFDPRAIKALRNPVRYEVWICVSKFGPMTIRDIGRYVRRDPGALYRHIETLRLAGLIHECGSVATRGRSAIRYTTPPNPYLAYDPTNAAVVDAIARVGENAARQAAGEIRRALETGQARLRSADRDTMVKAEAAWVDARELAEINAKIEELRTLFRRRAAPTNRKLVRLTLLLRSDA